MRLLVSLGTLLLAVGISAPSAQADSLETVLYEGFDYASGSSLDSLNGGTGWSGAWGYPQGTDSPLSVASGGLSYSGLTVTGLSTQFRGGTSRTVNGSGRDLERIDSGVVFVQFLGTFASGKGGGTPNLRFKDSALAGFAGGVGNNGGTSAAILDGSLNPTLTSDSGVSIYDGATHLMVTRIDYAEDRTDLWVDPDLSTFDYLDPPGSDAYIASFAPAFDRIYLYNKNSGSFDEIKVMRVVSGSAGSTRPGEPTRESLQLQTPEGVTCGNSSVGGTRGAWMTLPGSDECSVAAEPDKSVLGWATISNFPVEIAQRQVDNGWGAYELFDDDGRMTAVFIPAGGATFVSNSNSLYPVFGTMNKSIDGLSG